MRKLSPFMVFRAVSGEQDLFPSTAVVQTLHQEESLSVREGAFQTHVFIPYRFPARISSVESAGTDRNRLQGGSGFSLGISFMVAGFRVTDGVFHSGLGTTGCFTYPGTSGVEGQGSQ